MYETELSYFCACNLITCIDYRLTYIQFGIYYTKDPLAKTVPGSQLEVKKSNEV